MLDTAGKMLERIILQRLKTHIGGSGGFNASQYGFRNGFSTDDTIIKFLKRPLGPDEATANFRICAFS